MCARLTSGLIARFGRKGWIDLPARTRCRRTWTGTCGWARRRGVLTKKIGRSRRVVRVEGVEDGAAATAFTSHLRGAVGRTLAPARSVTWLAILSTGHSER